MFVVGYMQKYVFVVAVLEFFGSWFMQLFVVSYFMPFIMLYFSLQTFSLCFFVFSLWVWFRIIDTLSIICNPFLL